MTNHVVFSVAAKCGDGVAVHELVDVVHGLGSVRRIGYVVAEEKELGYALRFHIFDCCLESGEVTVDVGDDAYLFCHNNFLFC